MSIEIEVPVEDLIHVFFSGNFDALVVLGKGVHNVDLSHLLSEAADHVSVSVLPPGGFERSALGVHVALSVVGRNVKVPSNWAEARLHARFRVDKGPWFPGVWVEPMGNVSSCIQYDWVNQVAGVVLLDQLC